MSALTDDIHEAESVLLAELRDMRRTLRATKDGEPPDELTVGQRIADTVAATMGSWRFIIIQSAILIVWIVLNVTAYIKRGTPIRSSCSTSRCRSRRPMPRRSS